jgi:AAA family ATP:ADP antiporter
MTGKPDSTLARRACLAFFLILAAHAMTETARDALFLSTLPVNQLPWMYVMVAIASVAAARVTTFSASRLRSSMLPALVVTSAAIDGLFWGLSGSRSPVFLYLLYLWPAVFGSVVIVEFWRVVSDAYTIVEAKRVFGWIGAGGTAGAAIGSGAAVLLSTRLSSAALLLAAGTILAGSALIKLQAPRSGGARLGGGPQKESPPFRLVWSDPYLRGIAACLFLATLSATLTDFLFKGIVARDLPPSRLAPVFAGVGFGVNVCALVLQVAVVGWVTRRLGVTRSVAVLPAAIVVPTLVLLGGAGLTGAIAMRATDGALRYSLHRAISNLFYVPLSPRLRASVKSFIDVMTQRVGQVAGSLAILAVLGLGGGYRTFAVGVVLLSAATIVTCVRLRQPYLNLFRATLTKDGTETRLAYPDLDVDSLTSLVAAFSSDDDRAVIAAMDLVAEAHQVEVIPVVMLFHPSPAVVVRTLELFKGHGRQGFGWALDRLLRESSNPHIRAAALGSYGTGGEVILRRALDDDEDESVRATALVGLIARGSIREDEAARMLANTVERFTPAGLAALATAMKRQPARAFVATMLRLAEHADMSVRACVAEAMAAMPSERFLPDLRAMLPESRLREAARLALTAIGKPALNYLDSSLDDERLPREIRLHLPRSISRFDAADAVPILWRRLLVEPDDLIQRKILGGIGRLVTEKPESRPSADAVGAAIQHFARVGLRMASWRAALQRGIEGRRKTNTAAVLLQLLGDKQTRAAEFVLRLLGLMKPGEDFERIYRGLRGSRHDRASSLELLDGLLTPSSKDLVFSLLDRPAVPSGPHDETVNDMLRQSHGVLREVAARYHAELDPVAAS